MTSRAGSDKIKTNTKSHLIIWEEIIMHEEKVRLVDSQIQQLMEMG